MAFEYAGRVDEVPPGRTKFCCLNGAPVLLANLSGEVCAVHGRCSHQGQPLEGAILWGNLVDCPWHHFQYDVRTGENYYPANVYPKDVPELRSQLRPLRTYPVEVRGAEIWVDVP